MLKTIVKLLFIFGIVSILGGCTFFKMLEHGTMKEPELTFKDYEIADIDLDKLTLRLIFNASNPNEEQIDTFFVDYELFIDEKSAVKGSNLKVNLIPGGESELVVPVVVSYGSLFDTASVLADRLSRGEKEIASRVWIRIHGEILVHEMFGRRKTKEYDYSVNINTDIPLPEVSTTTVTELVNKKTSEWLGFSLFSSESDEEKLAEIYNPLDEHEDRLFYDFRFFAFDSAYDSRRAAQMVPDIETFDSLIYGTDVFDE